MYSGHPYDCTERKYPTTCQFCSQRVIYWECYHGSKVFFDNSGQHSCSGRTSGTNPLLPRPSGMKSWTTLTRVSQSVQPDYYDLLPGMERFRGAIAADLARYRKGASESQQRETVPMYPYAGSRDRVIGDVADVHTFYLPERLGLGEDSVLARNLGRTFPGLQATQITILVDDILNDPDAVDVMSYTVWCPTELVPQDLSRRQSISVTITSLEILSLGHKWVVEDIGHPGLE